jgi:hypothetical protein
LLLLLLVRETLPFAFACWVNICAKQIWFRVVAGNIFGRRIA